MITTADPWSVELSIREGQDQTHAGVRLVMDGGAHVPGHGTARRHPREPNVAQIGEKIAVARALSDAADLLLGPAAAELDDITHERARLHLRPRRLPGRGGKPADPGVADLRPCRRSGCPPQY